jgi:RimJ/RimL family protein N-acetyltransferase
MTPLFGEDGRVGEWAQAYLNKPICGPYTTIGWMNGSGEIVAAAIFNSWNGSNIEITICGKGGLTRGNIRTVMFYVFGQLKANRLTATTQRANARMRKLLPRLGFKFEYPMAKYYGPLRRDDGLLYRMFLSDAEKWMK